MLIDQARIVVEEEDENETMTLSTNDETKQQLSLVVQDFARSRDL